MEISYPNGRRASGRKAWNAVSLMAFRLWWGYATLLQGAYSAPVFSHVALTLT